jgi:hypothetical protein
MASRGAALITMMEPADFGKGDDLAFGHDGPSIGSIFTQGQVGSGAMIVGKIALQQKLIRLE